MRFPNLRGKTCIRRVFGEFVAKVKGLKVGQPFEADTNVGALISKEHYDRVNSYIDIAREDGGTF